MAALMYSINALVSTQLKKAGSHLRHHRTWLVSNRRVNLYASHFCLRSRLVAENDQICRRKRLGSFTLESDQDHEIRASLLAIMIIFL